MLVVEDEPLVRMIACEILLDEGLRVLEARHADQALELLAQHPEVALVFTDIDMPGSLNGLALRERLRGRAPELPVLVTSGAGQVEGQVPADNFIAKPYTADGLRDAVLAVLAKTGR